jgi:hypothetical protein
MILHQLSRVGIPAGILHAAGGGAPGESVHVELARILDRFPQAPELPTSRGCLVAVVGPRKAALRLAHHLAQRLDIDPDRVVVAAPGAELLGAGNEIVRSAAEAADGRRAWSRRKRPTVLVLESPIGRQSAEWAAGLLDELEPAMIWGVVEAARKPEDVKAWAAALGGLDAIDLRKLHETTSPASVLQTGIPVGYLDGRPATSARWATLLGRHLSAA